MEGIGAFMKLMMWIIIFLMFVVAGFLIWTVYIDNK